jgi:hypothetical protein
VPTGEVIGPGNSASNLVQKVECAPPLPVAIFDEHGNFTDNGYCLG